MDDLFLNKPLVDSYLAKGRYSLSAFSFVNIFAWSDFFRFEFREISGCLCVFAHQDIGCFQYLPPLGDAVTAEVIARCFDHMRGVNRGTGLSRIENVPEEMRHFFDARLYSAAPRSPEYCYRRDDIARMKGSAFSSQRWMGNHFRRHHDYVFEAYQPSDADACAGLYDRWAAERVSRHPDDVYRDMIRENRTVHRRVLESFEQLGLTGRIVRINGAVAGYTAGYPVSGSVFCDLFEIADLSFKGLPAVIFRELCRDPQLQGYEMINAMDDFEMPDVKRTKMNFKPRLLLLSYTVSER